MVFRDKDTEFIVTLLWHMDQSKNFLLARLGKPLQLSEVFISDAA